MEPVVVLLGPSGAGKSFLAGALKEKLAWLWIEADVFGLSDGISAHELRMEWVRFQRGDPAPLRETLRARAKAAGCSGTVLSLSSTKTVPAARMKTAKESGVHFFVLFGTVEECERSFRERELQLRRIPKLESHWRKFNFRSYRQFSVPEVAEFRIAAFTDGLRRSADSLIQDVLQRVYM